MPSDIQSRYVISILGVSVDVSDRSTVRAFLERTLAEPWDGHCRHIVTLNPEYVIAARSDASFAEAIAKADLVTADGIGIVVAARLLDCETGRRIGRATGVDLCGWLAESSALHNAPLFLLGGAKDVAPEAAIAFRERWPGTLIAGYWADGTPRHEDDEPALVRIAASGARVVLVAYGFPGQVTWIERNRAALAAAGVRLAVGIGGALDFYAGRVPRAPVAMRKAGLEWLYRLAHEPWRWRRQLALPKFATLVILASVQQRARSLQSRMR